MKYTDLYKGEVAFTTSKKNKVPIRPKPNVICAQKETAQQSVQLTAFGVGMLAFLAGFGVCWLVFVR